MPQSIASGIILGVSSIVSGPRVGSVRSRLTSKRSADGQIGSGDTPDLSDQLQLPRTTDRLVTVGRGQLAEDAPEVRLDGIHRNVHLSGDLGRAEHPRGVSEDLALTLAEPLDAHWCRLVGRWRLSLERNRTGAHDGGRDQFAIVMSQLRVAPQHLPQPGPLYHEGQPCLLRFG